MKGLMRSLLILGLLGIVPAIDRKISAQDEDRSLALATEAGILKVPGEYATIKAVVKAARSGDLVKVAAGVYNENVVSRKAD